ncbi:MAG: class I SAM-dependent methyltransferase [Syntrophomonadaceae bacterium]|nr:class I SAM-dependent methyltransferase [Syntrophomonadaceae bacterium]MDD3022646.1 class I SAM-dependent methyltransferase [Syntrophomonadaceae bacterium]
MDSVLSPDFWDREWKKFRENNKGYSGSRFSQSNYWNNRAEDFARSTIYSASKSSRTKQVFDFLDSFDIIKPGMRILDIGSGPGSFAIPFAAMNIDVVAIDPAPKMLEILRSVMPPELPGSITTVEGLWEDIDIKQNGWENNFDLVFASMCPGVHDQKAIEKMMLSSKKWCYFSGFSGSKKLSLHDEVLTRLFNRKYKNHFNDIIFPFNIIYSLGLKPSITFTKTHNQQSQDIDSYKSEILDIVKNISPVSPEIEAIIDSVIAKHSCGDSIKQQISAVVGMMVWQKSQ